MPHPKVPWRDAGGEGLAHRVKLCHAMIRPAISQAQFARDLGMSPSSLSAWWRRSAGGHTAIPLGRYLLRLPHVLREYGLDIDMHWLLTGEGAMLRGGGTAAEVAQDRAADWLRGIADQLDATRKAQRRRA